MKKRFVAHIRKTDKAEQLLDAHLLAVSTWSGQFASKIGLREAGIALGKLHDLGKATDMFQRYIKSGEGLIDRDSEEYVDPIAHKGKIDHTTSGAQVVYEHLQNRGQRERIVAKLLALCIASHHSGLIDCITPGGMDNFKRRMEKPDERTRKSEALAGLPEIQASLDDLLSKTVVEQVFGKLVSLREKGVNTGDSEETTAFKHGLLVRFLLSCLLDADRLDTAEFEMPGSAVLRNHGCFKSWDVLISRLDAKIDELSQKPDPNEVDAVRRQVSQACLNAASKPTGIYQLTVPTGGGKTLASLRFALHHAKCREMERVIYVIPYTSIIDQNAREIRKILEDKDEAGRFLDRVVLEHHSNLTPEEESQRHNLLAQNWDAPVVVTTQVQFLEALFGAGTRGARRMHQLAKSVIILDEVQAAPIKVIHMLNVALRFLVNDCGTTAVLCTATQPPLDKIAASHRSLTLSSVSRIVDNEMELFERLKRVEVHDERRIGGWDVEETAALAEQQLMDSGSVLAVVNTKRSARALYEAVTARGIAKVSLHHLSTNMCPAHRQNTLDAIKEMLLTGQPVVCVSTQLIEAGVDIDFGAVIRYLAGLDSIAQSAGRCNRHGLRPQLGKVWIVNPHNESLTNLPDIEIGARIAQRVLDDFKGDPQQFSQNRIGIEAMAHYYGIYYKERAGEMKYPVSIESLNVKNDNLFNLLSTNVKSRNEYVRIHGAPADAAFPQAFQTAAEAFRVIDSANQAVVVPYGDEGKNIIADLCSAPDLEKQFNLLKRAQRYSVNIFAHEFQRMAERGTIKEVQKGTGVYYLDERYYSDRFGWSDLQVNEVNTPILKREG